MMRNRFTIALMSVALLALVAGATIAVAQQKPVEQPKAPASPQKPESHKGMLDGKFFKGQMGKEGETTGQPYAVSFHGGMIHSHAEKSEGFAAAAYTATESNGMVNFTATTESPKMGKMEWQGMIMGDNFEATVTVTSAGKPPEKMWVKGKAEAMPQHRGKMGAPTGEKTGKESPTTPPKTK